MLRLPSPDVAAEAASVLAGLAVPTGSLGRLGDLAVWVCATQGRVPAHPVERVRAVVVAGDHGVAAHGVSAYPAAVTPAMVDLIGGGRAVVSVLAAQHDVALRVLDVSVGRPGGAIHLEDAVPVAVARRALAAGERVAAEEVAAGAQLLLVGEVGIGNTTPAAALVGALLGLDADAVTGRGTGVDDAGLVRKRDVVRAALDRAGHLAHDPVAALAALGGPDLATLTGVLLGAARAGVPVLLDGVVTLACALVAERAEPGAATWFAAGHRSTEPAQGAALTALGLEPLLDLGMRLGEGSGALLALPVVRSAALLLRDVAPLSEVLG